MPAFLTPFGALVALAALLPLAGLALAAQRVRRVRDALGLRAPGPRTEAWTLGTLVGIFALLALAATQPALSHDRPVRVRRDAQVLFVLDTSRSMAASSGGRTPTRLARAKRVAATLRASIPEVEAGVATLTDRVLPDLFPVADVPSFDATLQRAVGIEQPPPRAASVRATSYTALGEIPASGFFERSAKRRTIVLLSDGESVPFDAGAIADALSPAELVVVRVWRADESIPGEPAYHPDPAAPAILDGLAAAAGGRAVDERNPGAATRAIRASVGSGPTSTVTVRSRSETALAPFVAAAALVPLALYLRRRRPP